MLKRLAIFAVFLAIVQTAAPSPRVAPGPEGRTSAGKHKNAEADQGPRDSTPPIVVPDVYAHTFNYDPPKEQNKDEWDKAAVLSNYLLVVIGISGIIYAGRTLDNLKEQTKATKDAAEAALLNAQAVINSERPWLVAKMRQTSVSCLLPNGNVRFSWEVKNVGRSPAKILEVAARASLDTLGPSLERLPDYGKPESLDERILVPGDSISFFVFWSIVEEGKVRYALGVTQRDFSDLAIGFGYVKYRDTIIGKAEYISRFCDCANVERGFIAEPFSILSEAGAEYTKST